MKLLSNDDALGHVELVSSYSSEEEVVQPAPNPPKIGTMQLAILVFYAVSGM